MEEHKQTENVLLCLRLFALGVLEHPLITP